jgi:hypothetical protein
LPKQRKIESDNEQKSLAGGKEHFCGLHQEFLWHSKSYSQPNLKNRLKVPGYGK